MAERKDFFEVSIDFKELESHARSADSTMRWASAIELVQLGTKDAISLLWSLTTDADENVRDAAKLGLKQSYDHCLTFPWIKEKILGEELFIHIWFL